MKYDFSCPCGKGIRILRGDLAEVSCGACGRAVPVPPGVRAGLPCEFRGLAAPLPVLAPPTTSRGERFFFGACWAVAAAFFTVPFFFRSEAVEEPQEPGRVRGEAPPAIETPSRGPGTEAPPPDHEAEEPYGNDEPQQPAGPTAEEEQSDLSALQQSPSREGAIAFLDKYPSSPSRGAVASILLSQLEGTWQDPPETPSPSTLRQIIEAKGTTEITVSVTGFTGEDTKGNVFEHLKSRLEGIGLTVTQVESGGDVRVMGAESTDTTKTYNRFGLPESGPYAEDLSVTVEVYLPDAVEAAFSTASYASSPSSVGYTVFNDVDMGPSQWDVHRATLEELSKAMDPVFRYR